MKQRMVTILAAARIGLESSMKARKLNHKPEQAWPPHHLLCNCPKCMKQEFSYIREMRKEQRQSKKSRKGAVR